MGRDVGGAVTHVDAEGTPGVSIATASRVQDLQVRGDRVLAVSRRSVTIVEGGVAHRFDVPTEAGLWEAAFTPRGFVVSDLEGTLWAFEGEREMPRAIRGRPAWRPTPSAISWPVWGRTGGSWCGVPAPGSG